MSENLMIPLFFLVQIFFVAFMIYIIYRRWQTRIAEFAKMGVANGDTYHGRHSNTFRRRVIDTGHKLFRKGKGRNRRVNHLFEVPFDDGWMAVLEYEEGGSRGSNSQKSKETYHVVLIETDRLPLVQFSVEWEMMRHQIKSKLGLKTKDIDFDQYPDFSERFFLRGEDETAVRDLFSDDVIRWFDETEHMHNVSLMPSSLLLYARGKLRVEELEIHKRNSLALYETLIGEKGRQGDEAKWGSEHDWDD